MDHTNENFYVTQGSTVFLSNVLNDLIIEGYAVIKAKDGDTVFVKGEIAIKNGAFFECNLITEKLTSENGDVEISGNLEVSDSIIVRKGNLKIGNSLTANTVDIEGSLIVKNNFLSLSVNVSDSLNVNGDMKAMEVNIGNKITVLGSVKAEVINVNDSAELLGNVNIGVINSKGNVRVKNGTIKEVIVKGSLEVTDRLNFDRLDVGQTAVLGSASGGIISVGNKFTVYSDLIFVSMDVEGSCIVNGNCEGGNINVIGILDVKGDLKLSGMLNVEGLVNVQGMIISNFINVTDGIKAISVIANEKIDVSGTITLQKGIKSNTIKLNKPCKVIGYLIGDEIIIDEKCEVQDIYGGYVELGRESKAQNIYARDIRLEEKCIIAGNILFTNNLVIESNVKLLGKHSKVDEPQLKSLLSRVKGATN